MRPIRDLPAPTCSRAVRAVCFSCDRFRRAVLRSFRGRRRSADPVRGDKPGGQAGRLLRARRDRRAARRAGARADHAAGAKRGGGCQALGCFRKAHGYIVRIAVGRCNWQKPSSTSDFRRTIWSRCCGSGSRMPAFASITCCRFAAGRSSIRHDEQGSVIKINHHVDALPQAAPSGYRELVIARERLAEAAAMSRSRRQSRPAGAQGT